MRTSTPGDVCDFRVGLKKTSVIANRDPGRPNPTFGVTNLEPVRVLIFVSAPSVRTLVEPCATFADDADTFGFGPFAQAVLQVDGGTFGQWHQDDHTNDHDQTWQVLNPIHACILHVRA